MPFFFLCSLKNIFNFFDYTKRKGVALNNQKTISNIKKQMHNTFDFIDRTIDKEGVKVSFVYLKSITDNLLFSQAIFEPIQNFDEKIDFETLKELVKANDIREIKQSEILKNIVKGCVIVFLSNSDQFLSIDILKYNSRAPSEPPTSSVILGPREGFTEDLKTNLGLLRKRFYSNNLVYENLVVGKSTQTQVVVAYLDSIVDKNIVKNIKKRLKAIEIDGIVDSYYIATILAERPNSIFKQVGAVEKPDVVTAKMLEGRVAILVDNSPVVLTVPFVFLEDLQSSNDYYSNYSFATLIRIIRMLGLILAILGPGTYIALQLFHYSILPFKYLITIADSTQQVPFTPFVEIMFITLLFQILYEVSLRLPSYLGLATSIVGALILGETGVEAGLISPPSVIVVAIAKIALYTVPDQYTQITILQFVFLFLGAALGVLGIVGGMIYVFTYANSIENYGAPYFAPFAPFILSDSKDTILKVPLLDMTKRPKCFKNSNEKRINVDK